MKPPTLASRQLSQPAWDTARLIARARLERVVATAAPFKRHRGPRGGDETKARDEVHDFRVAVRRLRSWLRAFRPLLADTVTKGSLKKLKQFAHTAGTVRDLDVQLAWLDTATAGRGGATRAAHQLADVLRVDAVAARANLVRLIAKEFRPAATRLAHQLRGGSASDRAGARSRSPDTAMMFSRLLGEHVGAIRRTLASFKRPADTAAAHQGRIAIKRLRYLLEALRDERVAARIARSLERLQTTLGELHDADVLARRVNSLPPGVAALDGQGTLRTRLRGRLQRAGNAGWRATHTNALPATLARAEQLASELRRP